MILTSELKHDEIGAQPRFNPNLGLPVTALQAHTPDMQDPRIPAEKVKDAVDKGIAQVKAWITSTVGELDTDRVKRDILDIMMSGCRWLRQSFCQRVRPRLLDRNLLQYGRFHASRVTTHRQSPKRQHMAHRPPGQTRKDCHTASFSSAGMLELFGCWGFAATAPISPVAGLPHLGSHGRRSDSADSRRGRDRNAQTCQSSDRVQSSCLRRPSPRLCSRCFWTFLGLPRHSQGGPSSAARRNPLIGAVLRLPV